jgi:hypothetical protein
MIVHLILVIKHLIIMVVMVLSLIIVVRIHNLFVDAQRKIISHMVVVQVIVVHVERG